MIFTGDYFDDDSYPTDNILDFLTTYAISSENLVEFINHIKNTWKYDDWGFVINMHTDETGETYKCLNLHTGGWSGNEDVICALERNIVFWGIAWSESRRGGHYRFDLSRLERMYHVKF